MTAWIAAAVLGVLLVVLVGWLVLARAGLASIEREADRERE